MSRGRPKKCLICSESILNEIGVAYKGRTVHQKCFNIAMKTLQKDKAEKITRVEGEKRGRSAKPKIELKSNVSEEEYQQKQNYYNYIRNIINKQELSTKVYVLSEDYMKKYGFTFLSMYRTLVYLHEIIDKELTGDVVGIIPYYHNEAQCYYDTLLKTEQLNKDIDTSNLYTKKIIRIKPKNRKIKQINIESVGKEGDV